jgi:alpha-mannosidase
MFPRTTGLSPSTPTHRLSTRLHSALALGGLLATSLLRPVGAAEPTTAWQIGTCDNLNAEFALAPQGYQRFRDDGFFVVGKSDPKVDWPYVHPGPLDGWAGSRRHPFTIVFGVRSVPADGQCRLVVDLLDTQASIPPRLEATINGHPFATDLPGGAGDASVFGDPAKGREHVWALPFPAALLRPGNNEITLTTLRGSWLLYDGLRLEVPAGFELAAESPGTRLARVDTPAVWRRQGDQAIQPVEITLRHIGAETPAQLRLGTAEPVPVRLKGGLQVLSLAAPAEERTQSLPLSLEVEGRVVVATNLTLAPPKLREIWVLPHSHVDVGYTHLQNEIVRIQIENLEKAMQLSADSAARPPGMRFKWNPEAIWSLDHFLRQATPERRDRFLAAVRRGDVGIDALYGNMLTGLCRPEELARCLAFGPKLAELTGTPVESAAICDVPGWTWGIVPTMAQAGVKYFAIGPNHSARIGTIHRWDNRPFYWKSQSGRERVLCWVVDNYHHLGDLEHHVLGHMDSLGQQQFPFDMSFIYWVGAWPDGGVDNAPPDAALVDKVVAWNTKYAAPKVTIGLAREFFRDFERRHGERVPEFAGDLTPYWEDGAGSTSRETALNRGSAERLSQAEALFAMRAPALRPAARIEDAWKNVLLYSEHTWGAHNSISQPDLPFVTNQWVVKQEFALAADRQSREILDLALATATSTAATPAPAPETLEVHNTTQWKRTDLVLVPPDLAPPGIAGVTDNRGRPAACQRLASGELAFLATEVPAFGSRRFFLGPKPTPPPRPLTVTEAGFRTSQLTVELDPTTGAIRSLRRAGLEHEFVDPTAAVGLNDYRYVLGTNAAGAQPNGPVRISVVDPGPLVATVRLEGDAPGCRRLVREMRVTEGLDRIELVNHVDRLTVRAKDSVHFGFGFHVPDATVRMETPWAVVRPNADQLPGSCHNWFTVQRWVDLSNRDRGIVWAPVDAPLMQIGAITANLMDSVALHEWRTNTLASATVYSWAQNNHWFTNYKADQPGVTTFRYWLRPHRGGYSAADAARFGFESTRPPAGGPGPSGIPDHPFPTHGLLADVLLETLKVSEDGRALIVRLFGVAGRNCTVRLRWDGPGPKPAAVWYSDLAERPLRRAGRGIEVPGYGMVILRAEWP